MDWIGLQSHWAQRAGWLAVIIASAVLLYFAVLRVLGLDLRQFARRG